MTTTCFCSTTGLVIEEDYQNNTNSSTNGVYTQTTSSKAMNDGVQLFINSTGSSPTPSETTENYNNETGTFNQSLSINTTENPFINLDRVNPCGWNSLTNYEKRTLIVFIDEKVKSEDIRVVSDNILVPRWAAFCAGLGVVLMILIVAMLLFIVCCGGKKMR
ncbi:hypothetical protein ACQ4LE_007643 [Meloidogyne hapla]